MILLAPRVGAQPAPASGATPPRILVDPGVAYPDRAKAERYFAEAVVELVLDIDAEGRVRQASVVEPRGHGLDEAAVEAAGRLRFEPAQRQGRAVASRIRWRFRFEPPTTALTGRLVAARTGAPLRGARLRVRGADGTERVVEVAADGSWQATPPLPPGPTHVEAESPGHEPQQTDLTLVPGEAAVVTFRLEATAASAPAAGPAEVVIEGQRPAPTVTTLTRAEVRQIPGTFGDPFRAIELLPGVTPIISGLPYFFVRGSPPGNVGYYLDDIRVPYLYHLALGPSVVNPALVDRVDLYAGGYPARHGRFAGGIVAAETTAPLPEAHGEGNLRLFDVGAMVEAPFAQGRGTVLLGGRYSYTAAVLSLAAPNTKLDYRDYQARITYRVTPRDRLTLFGFGAYDLLNEKRNEGTVPLFGAEFYRLDLRHDHAFAGGSTMQNAVTLGYDQTILGSGLVSRDVMVAVRHRTHLALGRDLTVRLGVDATHDSNSVPRSPYNDPDDPDLRTFDQLFPSRRDLAVGAWADAVIQVARGLEVTPGLRLGLFQSGSATALAADPRLAARLRVSRRVELVHAYGVAHQPPSFIIPGAGLNPGKLRGGLQRSVQASAGVEVEVAEGMKATATVFHTIFSALSDALSNARLNDELDDFSARSRGSAAGIELSLRRRLTRRLGGFVSYTLSRSTRSAGRETFFSAADRTHVANVAVAYDLGRRWRAGTRLVFYTGAPTTPDDSSLVPVPRTLTTERSPAFHRIDVRIEKRWQLGASAWLSFVAEVLNTTLRKETFNGSTIGPVTIPSIGLEGGF